MVHQVGEHFPLIILLPPLVYLSGFYPLLNFPGHVCTTAIACSIDPAELASNHLTWGLDSNVYTGAQGSLWATKPAGEAGPAYKQSVPTRPWASVRLA